MKTKFNLDRDKPTSDFIHSQQNFKKVLESYHALKPPIWKNPWFYGPVGLASLALIFIFSFQNQLNAHGENSTFNLTSNTSLPEDTPCLQPVNPESDVPFQVTEVLPEKGREIHLPSGTVVSIPANVLESEKGKAVDIKIREFQDKESAFLAGIPMDYGKNTAFESAGMIEIRAVKDGKPIDLKTNKEIEVKMALTQAPDGFKFWKLDEKVEKWVETPCVYSKSGSHYNNTELDLKTNQTQLAKVETKIDECEKKISAISTTENALVSSKALLPKENARKLIIEYDVNQFPELKGYKDVEWEYLLPENPTEANLRAFTKRINYAQSQNWFDIDIKKMSNHYNAIFSNNEEDFTLAVRPVLKGKSLQEMKAKLENAEKEKNAVLAEVKATKLKYEKEEKELRFAQEKLILEMKEDLKKGVVPYTESQQLAERSGSSLTETSISNGTATFRTTSFGVFNSDRPVPYPPIFAHIVEFKTKAGISIKQQASFVFDEKKNTRYSFGGNYTHKNQEMGWFDHESTLVLVDKDGNLFYRKSIQHAQPNKSVIEMERLDRKDVNLDNIQKIIRETPVSV